MISSVDAALVTRILANNPRVRRLNLSENAISRLGNGGEGGMDDAALGRLSDLVALDLSRNSLRRLGAELAPFTALQVLDVSHNNMSVSPTAGR